MSIVSIKNLKTKLFGDKTNEKTTDTFDLTHLSLQNLQEMLGEQTFPNDSALLKNAISNLTVNSNKKGEINLTLKLPAQFSGNLEKLHGQLVDSFLPIGVESVMLHVIQEKVATPKQATAQQSPAQQSTANATTGVNTHTPNAVPTQQTIAKHPRIKDIIVVASGKGGVGKSTTTVNLALALQKLGLKVGVLDADIYGPSIPTMLNLEGRTPLIENEEFIPLETQGLAVLSIGNLTGDSNTPIVWRGPKATGALMQLYGQTVWPHLDVLLIDMPPGTGDIQLTLSQRIPVSGAVIVTTPQHVALMDAQKGIEMFRKVSIPVLGLVENMALHTCSNCGHEETIFGEKGGEKLSRVYGVPLLGQLPLNAKIREALDIGKPETLLAQGHSIGSHYIEIAQNLLAELEKQPKRHGADNRIF